MDEGATTYEHSLSLPLEEGTSKSYDVEGRGGILEWTVVPHPKRPRALPHEQRTPPDIRRVAVYP